jgi:hypothetical protein
MPTAPGEIKTIEAALDFALRVTAHRPPPLRYALRPGIRAAGQELHAIGGTAIMLAVAYDVADLDPSRWRRRLIILDRCWDNIGGGADVWLT